ncbi:MAG: polysaccharide biosynthesis tyrosine autokinase [Gomphosphaeria aponina SAG 52.96 = DSM 107014]|uniref:non-specific protein-tyrosine kinase n=1 Tax=Gomphosphaeria aponina SAG 52.96 = DSM 107014 TaxID=1521640 RepID=A0A941JSM9_9CHRO|nr:polysaccharide biosynthesis tyrosine autokinase [Gomphosphaeria aponina SAG 52.96 = DSM 107014]
MSIVAINIVQKQPIYQAKGRILFKKNHAASSVLNVEVRNQLESLTSNSVINTQAEIIKSLPLARKTIDALHLSQTPEGLAGSISVINIDSTDIIEVAYKSEDPDEATKITNMVMENYINDHIELQRAEIKAAGEFVAEQLPKIEQQVVQAEKELRNFKEQNNIINLNLETDSIANYLATLNQEKLLVVADLSAVSAKVSDLQQLFGATDLNMTLNIGIVSGSPGVQEAFTSLREIQEKLALEQTRFLDDHPTIIDLKSKKAALEAILQKRIQQASIGQEWGADQVVDMSPQSLQDSLLRDLAAAETERSSLEQKLIALRELEAIYQRRAAQVPQLEQQQRELERQLQVYQSTYEILLKRLQELRVTENQTIGNAQIIESATTPQNPIGSGKTADLIRGGILGILLGGAIAWVLESADKSMKSVEDVKKILSYPPLGNIPRFPQIKKTNEGFIFLPSSAENLHEHIPAIVTQDESCSSVTEAFRTLHTNIRFLNLDNQLKTCVVSSSIPREGKSTIVANLGTVMAQQGRQVLIVDADMRRPVQHNIWKISNEVGLSNVLTSQNEFHSAVVEVSQNLAVLPAGVIPPNPLVLLDSSQMAILMNMWTQHYDFVIFDSPPLNITADATILSKMVNGLLFVVKIDTVDSYQLNRAKEIMEQSELNILGLVINSIPVSDSGYEYYEYYQTKQKAGVRN